jgi:hypothetical protein
MYGEKKNTSRPLEECVTQTRLLSGAVTEAEEILNVERGKVEIFFLTYNQENQQETLCILDRLC